MGEMVKNYCDYSLTMSDAGEADQYAAAGDMFAGYLATSNGDGDLFDLVWRGRRQGHAMEASTSCLPPPPPPPPPPRNVPEMQPRDHEPPPEDTMAAAWLYPIVLGDEEFAAAQQAPPAGGNGGVAGHVAGDDQPPLAADTCERCKASMDSTEMRMDQKYPAYQEEGTRSESNTERRKISRARRSSHYSETHSMTEKRRRCKINEKLKTLQQLVPGCSKSNQASTLDQTIQYMKSLQQHIQAMSVGWSMKPAAAAAAAAPYPVAMQPTSTVAGAGAPPAGGMILRSPPLMVPFAAGPVLPLVVHHHPAAANTANNTVMMTMTMTMTTTPPIDAIPTRSAKNHPPIPHTSY